MEELFLCFNRKSAGIVRRAGDEWIILAGSRIANEDTCSYSKTGRIEKLIRSGYVKGHLFVRDYAVRSKTTAVTILGRHGLSAEEAEKKSCSISPEDAENTLKKNRQVAEEKPEEGAPVQEKTGTKLHGADGLDELEALITDEFFQKLMSWQKKVNIFHIVGQTHTEHWHSSFFAWLFNPRSNPDLGTFPLERLLYLYLQKKENAGITYEDLDNLQLESIEFTTERSVENEGFHGWKKGSIDVCGESEDLIIVIENKVTAKEEIREDGVGQTVMYYDYIEKHKDERQKSIYLFITPDPRQMPNCPEYVQITYQELYDYVISKCLVNPGIDRECRYVLEQYANNLKESYKKDNKNYPMALTHIGACEELYERHAQEFDDIFRSVQGRKTDALGFYFYQKYKRVFDEIYMSVEKYGETPASDEERIFVTFQNLVDQGKLQKDAEFVMQYDGVTYHSKLRKNEDSGEYCMILLDENGNFYTDDGGRIDPRYASYRTPSRAAGDAVYLYRLRQGDGGVRPSLNGRNYWCVTESLVKLCTLMA